LDIATLVGLLLGFGALIGGFLMEGGSIGGLLNPSAAIIVIGGTLGAALVSFPMGVIGGLPKAVVKAFSEKREGESELVRTFVALAEKARRSGLLSLEDDAQALPDPFMRKGVLLVVDGTDMETIETVLDSDIASAKKRHEKFYAVLETMGGYAPTMGIIGTVMGLVNVLSNLDEPGELGHAIAVAFIATLYGVSTANVLYLPLASKLKSRSKEEIHLREVMREGILSIQAGNNPRIVQEKLQAFMSASARGEGKPASPQGAVGAEPDALAEPA